MHKLIGTFFLTTIGCLSLFGNSFLNNLNIEILELENVECFGETSGYLELETTNGTAPYSYNLDGETNNLGIFEDLVAGNYTIIVTDQTGCSTTIDIEIEQPDVLELTVSEATNTSCVGLMDGSFQLTTIGGTPIAIGGYIYTLGAVVNNTGLFENLPPGVYNPIVEDENGCEMTVQVTINVGAGITASIIDQINVDCFGNATGEIQVEGADGVAPYEYRIDGEINTSGVFSNLPAGTYSMLIADDIGCEITLNFTISEPMELTASVAQMSNLSCFGANDGSFQVTANGGTQDYTFSTANDSNTNGIFNNQAAGTYDVIISDANNCMTTVTVTLTEPTEIVVGIPNITNVDCFGNSTGAISISATGGAGSISYSLNNQTNTTGEFSNLVAGNYMLTISDADNCETTLDFEISQPDEFVGVIDAIFNITCAGGGTGAIDFGTTGGTGEVIFTLNGMSNSDGVFIDLQPGEYTAMMVDVNNCQTTATATIEESDELGVNIIALNNTSCNGEMDGSITLEANGGSGNYSYTIEGETNSTGEFFNLAAGEYTASLTDDLGCSTMIDFTINEPEELEILASVAFEIACAGDNNATIQAAGTGGTGDYSYSIGLQNNDTGTFENLPAGTYPVMVADANGCTATTEITIESPEELEILVPNFGATSCFGSGDGFLQLMGIGGTGAYTYVLNDEVNMTGFFENLPADFYMIEVLDENGCSTETQFTITSPNEIFGQVNDIQNAGCNMMLGSIEIEGMGGTGDFTYTFGMETNTTGIFENIEAGTYEILLTDANDCTGTLAFNIEEGEDISAMIIDQEDVNCFGEANGFVEIEAMGGIGGVTFTANGETNDTGIFENLPAGNYEVEVTGDGGCTAIVPVLIEEPTEITFNIEATLPQCSGTEEGAILITAEGGAGDYIYTLNGETNTTGLFENLADAIYNIEIEDENGCTVETEFELAAPNALTLTILNIEPDNGSENGSFNVQGAGGTAPYQFSLDGINFQNTPPFSNLMFGDYTAYIMDANGCISIAEVTVPFLNNTFSVESGVAEMLVFPNPFVNDLSVELDLYRSQTLNFTIFNINGIAVEKMENTFAAGKTTISLSELENLAAGTYFLRVLGNEFHGYFKIIKQ